MNYNLEIQKILLKVEQKDNPDDRIVLLKQAIQLADANNDLDWGFDLRKNLIYVEEFTSHCTESFPAFTWLLSAVDSNPDLFEEVDVLRDYRWLATQSFRALNISREQVESILSDYQVRLQRNGYSNRIFYDTMVGWSLFLGEKEEARRYLDLRDNEPSDSVASNTELMGTMCVELFEGDFDKGILTANKFLDQRSVHQINPMPTYSLLVSYLAKANDPRAKDYFQKAEEEYAKVEHKYSSQLYEIMLNLFYLSKNDKEKAWDYFEKYSEWEIEADDAMKFDFGLSLLPLFMGEGIRTLHLNPRHPLYKENNVYDITEMYQYYHKQVNGLADAFDTRNGNRHFHEQIEEYLV